MPISVEPLFSPFTVKSLIVSNRFMMGPMTRSFSPEGIPGPDVAAYYERRAQADVGLIITEGVGVDHPAALGSSGIDEVEIPVLYGVEALQGWRAIVDKVHAAGSRIMPQLWHQGVMRIPGTGRHPDAASSRPSGIWGTLDRRSSMPSDYVAKVAEPTQPMSEGEIADIIDAFARSAANAAKVGFDGIALHGGHGYLLDTFLWAGTNRRTDSWGGDHVGRTRFVVEIVKAIRREIGSDLPIMYRYSQWKQQDFDALLATTPGELGEVLQPLCDAGVDIFDVSTRHLSKPAFAGSGKTLAGWTKHVTGLPTVAVGGAGLRKDIYDSHRSGSEADNLDKVMTVFNRGEFDLIAVARALMTDPQFVLKVRNGQESKPFNPEILASKTLYWALFRHQSGR
jgi:2,4-dienoyl-CoA reductase-like NADH-dependent reductase (Old Yellow Enzyme family)